MASASARFHNKHGIFHSKHRSHLYDNVNLENRAETIPNPTIADVPSPAELVRRATSTCTESNGQTCSSPSSGGSTSTTVPIAVGVAVPLALALIVFLFLHRRHIKRLRNEEVNDPHKSLDFGMEATGNGSKGNKKGKHAPEMVDANLEKSLRKGGGRGMSLDLGNPYILPPEMQSSRESLHSLSRTLVHGTHDPYRPATTFLPGETTPSLHGSRNGEDDASTRTGSTARGYRQDGMNQNLLHNAQRMSRSSPPPATSPMSPASFQAQTSSLTNGLPSTAMNPKMKQEGLKPASNQLDARDSYQGQDAAAIRQSNNYLGDFLRNNENQGQIQLQTPSELEGSSSNGKGSGPNAPASRKQSLPKPKQIPSISIEHEFPGSDSAAHEFNEIVVPPSLDAASRNPRSTSQQSNMPSPQFDDATPFYTPTETPDHLAATGLGVSDVDFDSRRLSIMRPLPMDDPNDNPEQRANRIRSFYKEYFSENEPARAYAPQTADYYEDYGQEFMGDGAVFDPATNQFIVAQAPFAEPVTRRAMTPPPRGPPRFQGPDRHQYTNSNPGSPAGPRGRAFSSASASRLSPGARGPVKRPAPPPTPLRTLPTPHLLKEDAFALPIDFAPPSGYKDRRAGRPDSPLSQLRPFSPQVPVASPLASSFNELPAMPSPHHLRKSGLFTGLDFAPPPRFKNVDSGSDASSIRSGKSAGSSMSAAQMYSIRSGAYRVSRIPKELVGSKNEFADSLKPSWKVGS